MNVIAELLTGSGYQLIAVICGLIVLEELGVPMPMAPGDLMLILVGASIAAGHVNPLVAVLATYLAALLGAVGGRELFARVGGAAVPRIAALLHAGDRVDELTFRLRRGGSASVFLGRITPGLRVVTNELAGLIAMPRRTFFIGLAPAVAVYEAVFIGLGAWLGKTALQTIDHYAPTPGELVLVLAILVASALAGRALVNLMRGRRARRQALAVAPL